MCYKRTRTDTLIRHESKANPTVNYDRSMSKIITAVKQLIAYIIVISMRLTPVFLRQ